MQNIFDDSDDYLSDDASVSNRRLSRSIVPTFEENDDNTEKKAKRKSMLIGNGSIAKIIANPVPSSQKYELPSGYTEEQIGIHYGNCIKLASENKINSKNAFDLYLIDVLSDYVKELKHFQTISSTLDAGSKIYAGRVDSIHQNTYQVLTGLGNPSDEKTDDIENVDVPNDPVSDEDMELKAKKTKRKLLVKNTICQNIRKIRIDPSVIKSEVDPLFQSQAENFDEGGNCELRCNNLKLMDKTYDLLLDSEKIISTNYRDDQTTTNDDLSFFDLSASVSMFRKIRNGQIKLLEQFDDFIFTGWLEGSETMNSTTAESFRNMINEISKLETANQVNNEPMIQDDDYGSNDCGMDNDHDYNEIMQEEKIDDDDEPLVQIGSSKADIIDGNMFISTVKGLVNSVVEHYGELNHSILGLWAGPQYFKQKAKPFKTQRVNTEKRVQQTAKPSNQPVPIFPEHIQTKLNDEGIGRVVLPDNWNFTKSDHPSTVLTEVCLNKNMKKDYLLPPRTLFSLKSINQLMNREVSLINKVLKNQTEKLPCSLLNDDDKVLNYDYNNANDMLEFCPRPASLVADDDGNVTVANNNDFNAGFDNDDDLDDQDAYTGRNSFQNLEFGNFNDQDPVTANVRRVEQIDIDYAKTAKRINVKKLKSEIWTNLKTSINAAEMEVIKNHKFPDVPKTSNTSLFSNLLMEVDRRSSKEASNDLSVSILMTCLLHLSNESGLDLISTEDLGDLIIGQGYSQYDIEQINNFGIGNCLINDSRKRKSLDKADSSHKRKMASNLFSDICDDDE